MSFINDFIYYVIFVDDYSKFTWLYLFKFKSDVFEVFNILKQQLKISLTQELRC